MGPFSNDPAPTGGWARQPLPAHANQGTPGWAKQPEPTGIPQAPPPWQRPAAYSAEANAWAGQQSATPPPTIEPEVLKSGANWSALRMISRYLKIIAWISLLIGFIIAIEIGNGLGPSGLGFPATLFFLYLTAIGFVLIYASAELILVFLAIEKNTRKNE